MKDRDRKEGAVSVLALDGRIVFDKGSNALREQLKSLITGGHKNIVLDMKSIEHIDGSGLGTLVAAHVGAKSQGASLRLCQLGKRLQEVLEITNLATVFQVCNPDAATAASFPRICTETICPVSA
jgi:anti-anti-sigma factor